MNWSGLAIPQVSSLTVASLLALLALSAFFASSEASLFSLQRIDREALKEDRAVGETVRHLLAVPRRVLAAILIGNEIVNIALAAACAQLVPLPWLNVVIVAPLLVLLGDIVPKTLGIRFARTLARATVRPLSFWNELVSPLRFVLATLADGTLRLLGFTPQPPSEALEEAQLRALIDQGRATGVIQPMEQEIIHRVFEFGDLPVSRVMTPRPDIFALPLTTPWSELLAQIKEARYSRVPIYQGQPENVIGILLVKDLLRARGPGTPPNPRQVQKMLHPAMFVPPSKRAQDLLREFRQKNMHLAIVVDEHGSCVGIVTLDDLLTELVGEVLDETDEHEKETTELGPGVWGVKASMDVDDFGAKFERQLPEGEYTTVGGFVFHLLGRAPEKGDEVPWERMRFLVADMDGRRITELTVAFDVDESRPAGDT